MLTLSLLTLVSWIVLYFVLRHRIHVHITTSSSSLQPAGSQPPAGKRGPQACPSTRAARPARRAERIADIPSRLSATATTRAGQDFRVTEIRSALENLGATRKEASAAAEQAVSAAPGADLAEQIRAAIQHVQRAA